MTKKDQGPIQASDIEQFLGDRDDFAFEMEVYRALSSVDTSADGMEIDSSHSGTYCDPVTGKDREYDIRAVVRNGDRCVKLAVECKRLSPSRPLVISRCPRYLGENYHDVMISKPPEAIHEVEKTQNFGISRIFSVSGNLPYLKGDLVGKSAMHFGKIPNGGFKVDDKEIYEKWSQAVSSSEDLIRSGIYQWERYSRGDRGAFCPSVVIPLVVVPDETLWAVDYGLDGSRVSEPGLIDECSYYIGKLFKLEQPQIRFEISHLHIFTLSSFKNFVGGYLTDGIWKDYVPSSEFGCYEMSYDV